MNNEVKSIFIFVVFVVLILSLLSFVIMWAAKADQVERLQGEAVERGYADIVYKDNTLRFQWREPEKTK